MHDGLIISIASMLTAVTMGFGVPIVRAYVRRMERAGQAAPTQDELSRRLERIEQAIDAMSIEVERISEGQRFTTKLLAARADDAAPVTAAATARPDQFAGGRE